MKFGQTHVLKSAAGKIAVGIALAVFGAIAVLAAPSTADALLCGAVPLLGAGFLAWGIRQDRADKAAYRNGEKGAKK